MKKFFEILKFDQLAILFLSGASIYALAQLSPWGHVIGICAQPFWFYTSAKNKQWGVFINTAWWFFAFILGIFNGFFPGSLTVWQLAAYSVQIVVGVSFLYWLRFLPDFLRLRYYSVELKLTDNRSVCNLRVIVNGGSIGKIESTILRSGFAVVDTKIVQVPRPKDSSIFIQIMTVKELGEFLVEIRKAQIKYIDLRQLSDFDPQVWHKRQKEIDAAHSLAVVRRKLVAQISSRSSTSP